MSLCVLWRPLLLVGAVAVLVKVAALGAGIDGAVWSKRMPLANSGAMLTLLGGRGMT